MCIRPDTRMADRGRRDRRRGGAIGCGMAILWARRHGGLLAICPRRWRYQTAARRQAIPDALVALVLDVTPAVAAFRRGSLHRERGRDGGRRLRGVAGACASFAALCRAPSGDRAREPAPERL